MVRNPLSKLPLSLCPARPLAGALSPTAPICGQQRAPRRLLTHSFRRQNLLQNRDNLTIVRTRPGRAETSGHRAAILRSEACDYLRGFCPANAAADELREIALAVVAEAAESLAADFIECLNRTTVIGAAVAAVS